MGGAGPALRSTREGRPRDRPVRGDLGGARRGHPRRTHRPGRREHPRRPGPTDSRRARQDRDPRPHRHPRPRVRRRRSLRHRARYRRRRQGRDFAGRRGIGRRHHLPGIPRVRSGTLPDEGLLTSEHRRIGHGRSERDGCFGRARSGRSGAHDRRESRCHRGSEGPNARRDRRGPGSRGHAQDTNGGGPCERPRHGTHRGSELPAAAHPGLPTPRGRDHAHASPHRQHPGR